jgi:hypothetical protein
MTGTVWIVQQDEDAHNTVLGVFGSRDEANAFAVEVEPRWAGGVLITKYEIGFRYDRGSRYTSYSDN